jgi:hypothetical protein
MSLGNSEEWSFTPHLWKRLSEVSLEIYKVEWPYINNILVIYIKNKAWIIFSSHFKISLPNPSTPSLITPPASLWTHLPLAISSVTPLHTALVTLPMCVSSMMIWGQEIYSIVLHNTETHSCTTRHHVCCCIVIHFLSETFWAYLEAMIVATFLLSQTTSLFSQSTLSGEGVSIIFTTLNWFLILLGLFTGSLNSIFNISRVDYQYLGGTETPRCQSHYR